MSPLAIVVNIDPVLVQLGPIALTWYGLAVAVAILIAIRLTLHEARRKGISGDAVLDVALWAVFGGIIGARLLHVVDHWNVYAANPMHILAIQNGGLAIVGGVLGGMLAGGLAAWRRGLPIRKLADAAAPGIILGQAIGRLGCLVNGDALGRATDAPWGIAYQNAHAMAPQLGVAYQPVFLFEQAYDLGVFGLLWFLRRRFSRDGYLFAAYLSLYAAGKFFISFLRTEAVWVWGLQEAQLFALGALLIGGLWAVVSSRSARRVVTA